MNWSPFRSKTVGTGPISAAADTGPSWDREGITIHSPLTDRAASELSLFLSQLEEEGFATALGERTIIRWPNFYRIADSLDYRDGVRLMQLPTIEAWRPALASRGTLTDSDFSIFIREWTDPEGNRLREDAEIQGAVICAGKRASILPESTWRLVEAIAAHAEAASARTTDDNRRAWAEIRAHALRAGADLADFLQNTIVLTPEQLRIGLRKGQAVDGKLIEVMPEFEGAPARWLEIFDRMPSVQERYEVPDGLGMVHVLVSPEVRTVLQEIRRMPGRRIAGERAEAFVRNPFATLGPDASKVIDAGQFETARDAAGISFARFTAKVAKDANGFPYQCAIVVEESFQGELHTNELRFEGPIDLERFLSKLESKIASGAQCCHWEGFDLEILGDSADQARILRDALPALRAPSALTATELFDLSNYSDRIEGFGTEQPYYSPFIARNRDDAGWFPENVEFGLCYTPEGGDDTIAIPLDRSSLASFEKELNKAQDEGRDSFAFPGCPKPIPVTWAIDALATFHKADTAVGSGGFNPKGQSGSSRPGRRGLVVKANVDTLDYEERRGALAPTGEPPRLPQALRPNVALKDYQLGGVAWLQHLWRESPTTCRGALLADDMGLGKTIQILAFLTSLAEQDPSIDPFLIVAPVSLLDNWKEEIAKFFAPGSLEILTLYGASLAQKRVSKKDLDSDLLNAGATRLLIPGWRGSAKLVLTTYETLRDLEFSLARQRWSVMVCDEAQKVKNPNALVTRAAKKQNARFKIACTGTPVENTLTDIWCLFDFVQPGLLGALKGFGQRYRRPIEAETAEEKIRVEELRALIAPQMLRRTKTEVAKDLPKKYEVESCRTLPLSPLQRARYADAVAAFRRRDTIAESTNLQSPLGLLQYLRKLCSDPQLPERGPNERETVADIERISPKMAWLVGQLGKIQSADEKAIVFCESRELQRKLQRVVLERFGFLPDVINGETSTESTNSNSRQRRIRAFQERAGFSVIVLSPLAVGFGVNIQAANHVIHLTRTWNPAKEDQATDRAYRIGQEKDVYVYYPVVVAPDFVTFDAKLDRLLDWKRSLSADMLNGTADISSAEFDDLEAPGGGLALS